jgi:uncharacterized glyoxalase superfamily protein PhnB
VTIQRQASVLVVSDIRPAIAYWNDKLGFGTHGSFGEPVQFAIMERDRAYVMLRQAPAGHVIVPYWKVGDGLWNAYFWVDAVDALFDEIKARGATIDYGLCDQPYGVRDFGVRDPDDQGIGFGQVIGSPTGAPPA